MTAPNATEAALLERCKELLQFAAENKTGLPAQVVTDIQMAWDAQSKSTWTPEVATKFWTAYDGLCSHLRPLTWDTLTASRPEKRRWGRDISLAHKWARGFGLLLFVILLISLVLAFISTAGEILIKEVEDLITKADQEVVTIREQIAQRPSGIDDVPDFDTAPMSSEARVWVTRLREHMFTLWILEDQLYEKTNSIVSRILLRGRYQLCASGQEPTEHKCYFKGTLTQPKSLDAILAAMTTAWNFFETRRTVRTRTDQAITYLAAIKAYLLPAFLGMLGACTFVVRTISDQLKDFTFSHTSPLRHLLRVALGSIVGVVVVTFYGTPTGISLSASAWAFVAGYAMEAVFAAFDAVVSKLRS
jgi:hypothetical protein